MSLQRIDLTIKSFIKDTGLPLSKAAEAMSLSSGDFMKWWICPDRHLIRDRELLSLARFLNIYEGEIVEGNYDKDLVRTRIFNDVNILPEKYTINAFSYLRTSAHIPKYFAMARGQHFSDQLMRKLSVPPLIYKNVESKINLKYFMDLLEVAEFSGFSAVEIDSLAGMLFLGLGDTPLGQKLQIAKNHYDFYAILVPQIYLFDSNFEYHSELEGNMFRLTAYLDYDKMNPIKFTQTQLNRLLRYRKLLVAWLPYLAGLRPIMPQMKYKYDIGGVEAIYTMSFSPGKLMPLPSLPADF